MTAEKLKPCPFCGGEASMHHDWSSESGDWYVVDCLNDGCMRDERSAWSGQSVSTGWRKTEAGAVAAWNRRTERTCCNDLKDSDFGGVWPISHFKCSTCGELFTSYEFDYCPNCGAKVVE